MKIAVLFSGGKDSTLALHKAIESGHSVSTLISVISKNPVSYMYHTENINLVKFQANAMNIPLVVKDSSGEKEKELDDLRIVLDDIRGSIDGIVSGAVESMYQFSRIKRICEELGLEMVSPLWHKNPEEILGELISSGFVAIITAVKADGFSEDWLGRVIDEHCLKDLVKLKEKHGIHIGGEGGEYETFVVDGPIFKKKIGIMKSRKRWTGVAGELFIENVKLIDK